MYKRVLNKSLERKLCEFININKNVEPISRFYQLTKLKNFFNFPNLAKLMKLNYRKRWFTMFVETDCFLKLNYARVVELLSSSHLQVTSEIEVFDAAESWIKHNTEERSKHAKDLLLQIRFPLLPHRALKFILNSFSSFQNLKEFRPMLTDALKYKNRCLQISRNQLTDKYCFQNFSSLLVCGGRIGAFYEIDQESLRCVKQPVLTSRKSYCDKAVCVKGEVYIFDSKQCTGSIEKYSPVSNSCKEVANLNDVSEGHSYFSVCTLMGKIYLIGGYTFTNLNTCLEFDPNGYIWKERASMIKARTSHAGVTFEGRIVVSGGIQRVDENNFWNVEATRTVEQYDHVSNTWSKFHSMINTRCYHQSVVVKNKLFVIGGGILNSEIYDSTCKKFVALKQPGSIYDSLIGSPSAAVTVGNEILIFGGYSSTVLCYDSEEKVWSEKSCEVVKYLNGFSCVQVPKLNY